MIKKETIKDGVVETFYENGQLRNRKNYKAKKRNYKVKFDDDFDDDIPF